MTNYDRIKAMSVEEMAEFLNHCENYPCFNCVHVKDNFDCGDGANPKDCINGIKAYLESEVSE